jgi:Mrp family chromosome partitioning ATPase
MTDEFATTTATASPVLSLALRRNWRLLVVCLVLGAVLAGAFGHWRTPEFVATTSVLVTPSEVLDAAQPANGQRLRGPVNLATEAELVRSTTVAEIARARLADPGSVTDLLRSVRTAVPTKSSVLEIAFSAPSRADARLGAQAFAAAYLANRERLARANLDEQMAATEAQIAHIRAQLSESTAAVAAATPESPEAIAAQAGTDLLTSQLASLSRTLGTLQSTTVTPGRLITDAQVSTEPTGPDAAVLLGAGALLGLVVGAALALVRERTDRRVRGVHDLGVLVDVPVVSLGGSERRLRPLSLVEPQSTPAGQEFQRLRNSLMSTLPDGPRLIVVAGTAGGQAAAAVAVNIAAALAWGDSTVVLVDANPAAQHLDPARPEAPAGLTDVLEGQFRLEDVIRPVPGIPNLRQVSVGRTVTDLSRQLQTRTAVTMLAGLRASADVVVVHTAPTTTSPDVHTVARLADAGLLVVEAGSTLGHDLVSALVQVREVGLARLWCVLTRSQARIRPDAGVGTPHDRADERPEGREDPGAAPRPLTPVRQP